MKKKTGVYNINVTKHWKLNSYRVMNSHMANSVHTADSLDPVIQIKSIYAYIMNI